MRRIFSSSQSHQRSASSSATAASSNRLRIGLAEADTPAGPYRRKLNHPVLEGFNVEDPFVWHDGKRFRMLAKDMTGEITGELHAGAAFESNDGIDWRCLGKGYSRAIRNERNEEIHFGSLERPQLLLNEHGEPEYLFAAVADGPGGFRNAAHTWNICAGITGNFATATKE